MDLSAAAALCLWLLSACRPRDGLEAAAVLRAAGAGPAGSPGGGGSGGRTLAEAAGASVTPAAAAPGARASRRGTGSAFRNGSVVPHQFMMSLYRTLAGRTPAGSAAASASGSGRSRRADTITGFADQATQDESAADTGQSFLFDVSSLSDADEVVGAELRVLRRGSPEPGPGSTTAPPLLLLSTCPEAARAQSLLSSRAAEPLRRARWEVFDVADAVRGHRREPRAPRMFCLLLRAVAGPARAPLALSGLGFGSAGGGSAASESRALLVVSSRTQRKESLFREIRAQSRALGAALTAEQPPDPGPGTGSPAAVLSGRRRRRTALAGARATQGSGGGAGRGQGRRGRSRCSRKPLHVDFKELGWDDWIIAPLDYQAYHCEGVCDFPLRSHLEPTNHAIIQTLLNSMAPDAAPASCCVPARLSPISILYIDAANNVVYKQYEDMVVEACGCR
ncbi:growth/differentiation factor 7 [Saccopteryx bilineata]|uniref:growth/differentiation factor 7 n=1 Tax=Saccopteryx bilineata TaxID=59482 RepID=UPI00338E871B